MTGNAETVRYLIGRGWSTGRIAMHLKTTDRSVRRYLDPLAQEKQWGWDHAEVCERCGGPRHHDSKGLCRACYDIVPRGRHTGPVCVQCGEHMIKEVPDGRCGFCISDPMAIAA